jgi:DNA-binding transcriptional MerR regulator
LTTVSIPNRPVFRAQEVCELAEVQPYVLRTWEAEFPDLGVAKTTNGPRVYRRADVERVLRIKHLILVEGLTMAGVRRQLGGEVAPAPADVVSDADVAALMDSATQHQLREVRRGLQWILGVLSGSDTSTREFVEQPAGARVAAASGKNGARPSGSSTKTTKPAGRGKKR